MNGQMTLFDYTREQVKIDTPIRLIELFAGYGSQAMALRNLGADFEHYRVVEFDKYAMDSYNAIHGTNFNPTDINDVKGVDMGIVDKSRFTYLLTYLLIPVYRYFNRRTYGRYGRRFGNTIIPFMAGQTDS